MLIHLVFIYYYVFSRPIRSTTIVTFGDSLSDTGNVALLSNGTWPRNRKVFSNGLLWNQIFANQLGAELNSYAYGGATLNHNYGGYSGPESSISVPSVDTQIQTYLSTHKFEFSRHIFVLFAGGNDKFFYPNLTGSQVASWMVQDVNLLKRKQFFGKVIILNLPPLDKNPYLIGKDKILVQTFANYTIEFNNALDSMARKTKYFKVVDIYRLISDMLVNPPKYGFAAEQGIGCEYNCTDPNEFIFWDAFHFTERVNSFMAAEIANLL